MSAEGPNKAALRDVTVAKSEPVAKSEHLRPPQDRLRPTSKAFENTMRTSVASAAATSSGGARSATGPLREEGAPRSVVKFASTRGPVGVALPATYLAFCDESGQRDYGPKTDAFFIVASVLVPDDSASHLEDEIRGLKRAFWGNPDIEIKSNWIRQPKERHKNYTAKHGLGPNEIDELVAALYRWLKKTPLVFLAGVVDKPMMEAKYGEKAHYAGGVAYTMFLQRYEKFLGKRGAVTGNVVFDDPAGKSPGGFEWRDLLKKQHARLKKYQCPYTRTPFNRVGALTFADSASSVFIQIADLVSYNTFRQFRMHGAEWEHPKTATWPLYPYFEELAGMFDRGPKAQVAGYGIAKWPMNRRVTWTWAE